MVTVELQPPAMKHIVIQSHGTEMNRSYTHVCFMITFFHYKPAATFKIQQSAEF